MAGCCKYQDQCKQVELRWNILSSEIKIRLCIDITIVPPDPDCYDLTVDSTLVKVDSSLITSDQTQVCGGNELTELLVSRTDITVDSNEITSDQTMIAA